MQKEQDRTDLVDPFRIHIIGKGAIGLLLGHYLTKNTSNPVSLCLRDNKSNSNFTYQTNTSTLVEDIALTHDVKHQGEINFLIIPTKSYDVLTAFLDVQTRLTHNAVIILCHNGMGTIEQIKPLLSDSQSLFFLTTTMGAYKSKANHVMHTGFGPSALGPINQAAINNQNQVFKVLSHSIPDLSLSNNIKQLLWDKLMINIAINPLSAIYNVKNGELNQPKFALEIFQLLHEAYLVAKEEGVDINFSKILISAYTVMQSTAQNYSSMNRDHTLGKKTEISAISGYIVELAKQHQIEVPHNQSVYLKLS